MSKSWFVRTSVSSDDSRDGSPLLPQHEVANHHTRAPEPRLSSSTRATAVDRSSLQEALPDSLKFGTPNSPPKVPPTSFDSRGRTAEHHRAYKDIPTPVTSFALRNTSAAPSLCSSRTSMSPRSWHIADPSFSASILDGRPHALPASLSRLIRNQIALQDELQRLLDSQAASLVQGRHAQTQDAVQESKGNDAVKAFRHLNESFQSGSSTKSRATLGSWQSRQVVPVRQPEAKDLTLQETRKAILQCILTLSKLKGQEIELWKSAYHEVDSARQRIIVWNENIDNLTSKIKSISKNAASKELKDLQAEKDVTDMEIKEQEDRLLGLRAKQSRLVHRIREMQNTTEASTSSFLEGRREMEKDIKRYLERPFTADSAALIRESAYNGSVVNDHDDDHEEDDEGQMFLLVPANRRTLAMGLAFVDRSIGCLRERLIHYDDELFALEYGAKMWADVLDTVTDFEAGLRKEMMVFSIGNTEHKLKEQVEKMEGVIHALASHFQTCHDRGWNLLICAVGAELDAFNKGYKMLQRGLTSTTNNEIGDQSRTDSGAHKNTHDHTSRCQAAHEDDKAPPPSRTLRGNKEEVCEEDNTSESEDEGPHPDLLSEDRGEDEISAVLGL